MLDVVLAGIVGAVLAVLLTRPPKRRATPTREETPASSEPVAAAAKPQRAKHVPNKWD